MMRSWLAVTIVIVGFGLSAIAQDKEFRPKPVKPTPEKDASHKSATIGKMPAGASATAKDLKSMERTTARTSVARASGIKKTGPPVKLEKDSKNPPINFGKNGGGQQKGVGMTARGNNPYKGRLKQKGSNH